MPQREVVPTGYKLKDTSSSDAPSIHLEADIPASSEKTSFNFEPIKPGIFRTTFTTPSHPLPPYPSAARVPSNPDGFTTTSSTATSKAITCSSITATLDWSTGLPLLSISYPSSPPLLTDLPHRSYTLDGPGVAHYTTYNPRVLHLGLGEKSAPFNLSGRTFSLSATDSFGYDAHLTDPMYKHIPFLIRATPDGVIGTFSTTASRGMVSLGGEMDGMWGRYVVQRQDYGGLEQYTLVGRTLQDVVRLYADLVGYPLLVPRWAFGYIAGGYKYAMQDEPRASVALDEFAGKLDKYDIPCSGFQLSSGYTVAATEPKNRHVFTWNRERFPDPEAWVRGFRRRGIRIVANVKPYLVASHPDYEKLKKEGGLFTDSRTGESAVARLWSAGGGTSGEGGHIDFTSQAGYDWWVKGVRELREIGIDCPWNDNNEYVIPDDGWQLKLDAPAVKDALRTFSDAGHNRKDIGLWGRYIHTELNGKASNEALVQAAPHERPFVLTRAATAGTMRYAASSWSGDNTTSWESMRGGNAISLTAGLCLLQCYGHDIGGFEGPQPEPELLVRWVQLGCHSPRFAINCFKTTKEALVGDVIEPWMYPEVLPILRKAICRRYSMIPYLYNAHLLSHLQALPPQRWVGWGYEADPEIWTNKLLRNGETQYWLGDNLIIGGVYEPAVKEAKVYLPKRSNEDPGFLNTNEPYQCLEAGQWHNISSSWDQSIPIIARVGGIIPLGRDKQTVAPGDKDNEANLPIDDWRAVEIFPPPADQNIGQTFENEWLEDDGISPAPAKIASFKLNYSATKEQVKVEFQAETSKFVAPWLANGLTIILPAGDVRDVVSANGRPVNAIEATEDGRKRWHVKAV